MTLKFNKSLYSKVALIKAAYNYTDRAYIHLGADKEDYVVEIEAKEGVDINEKEFMNEMLAQSVRHEVYNQTKNIRELILARALATSVLGDELYDEKELDSFTEDEILMDWFKSNEEVDH